MLWPWTRRPSAVDAARDAHRVDVVIAQLGELRDRLKSDIRHIARMSDAAVTAGKPLTSTEATERGRVTSQARDAAASADQRRRSRAARAAGLD